MRIIATIRTLNEEDNIEKCCKSYAEFCDLILIGDGGSTDRTIEIAEQMPKTKVGFFLEKVECANGIWRNPDYKHLMFLWDWAIAEGADWIISQDCDQRPNKFLKQDARIIFEDMKKDFLMATQIYVWGKDYYFPELSGKDTGWMQGLWAWRANINMKVIDKMPHFEFSLDGNTSFDVDKLNRHEKLLPPYCYLHLGWQTEEQTNAHIEYYKKSELIKDMLHPINFGGRLEPLEDWMVE